MSVSHDRSMRIWNIQTGGLVQVFPALDQWDLWSVKQINSEQFAIGKDDSKINIYDVYTYQFVRSLTGHTNGVTSLEVLSNGLLASGSYDHSVRIWNTTSGQTVQFFDPLSSTSVFRVRQLQDGSVAICGDSTDIARYKLNIGGTPEMTYQWTSLNPELNCQDLLVSGQNLLMAIDNVVNVVNVVNQTTNQVYMTLNEFKGSDEINGLDNIKTLELIASKSLLIVDFFLKVIC